MTAKVQHPNHTSSGSGTAFAAVTTLFFAWGFITSLVDPLVAAVKSIFSLSNLESQLSAFAFFIAYGLISLPAAIIVGRLRAIRGIVLALGLMVAACLIILAASNADAYGGVLAGLFVLASGITILQVAANPLAAALGPPERSHFRLTFSQAFNSLGTVLGPLLGAHLLLEGLENEPGTALDAAARTAALGAIDRAFLIIAGLIVLLAIFIWAMRRRVEAIAPPLEATGIFQTLAKAITSKWALLGGLAIFLYVGAEVSIGTQMALFLNDKAIWGTPLQRAGYFVSLYWMGAMIGRFIGSGLMLRVAASHLLLVAAVCAALLCLYVFLSGGGVNAGYAALAVGLFNSIMFPTIFTLTLERSDAGDAATSGFLCTAIIGGAFIPLAAGVISDAHGYTASFVLPALCYALIAGFAYLAGRKAALPRATGTPTSSIH